MRGAVNRMKMLAGGAAMAAFVFAATPSHAPSTRPERLLGRLAAEYEYSVVDEIVAQGLHEHLDELQSKLNDVGGAIYETFFAARPEPSTEQRQENGPQ